MQVRSLLALTTALMGSAALTPVTAFAAPLPTCAQLAINPVYGLAGNAYVTNSPSDNQGLVSPSAAIVPATSKNAAYCLLHLQFSALSGPGYGYAPGKSQTVGIDVGLPLNSTDGGTPINPTGYTWTAVNGAWNGKVENVGGGGLAGSLGSVTQSTNAGYVGSITDGGHNTTQNGSDATFAVIQATHQLDTGKITDFASESLHQQYVWALALANSYYGQPATRNYWYGCSTGGRQGLELAQKWGYDFDGFVVGAAVVYWDAFDLAGKAWAPLVNRDVVVGAGHSAITTAQYQNAVSHAIQACDVEGTDVVADGVVDDPRQCMYRAESDPTILSAPAGTCTGATCLDTVQANGIDKMWEDGALNGGPHNRLGRKIWYGLPPTILSPSGGIGPAIGTGSTNPEKVYDEDHANLTGNVQNIYASRNLAQANPLGMPSPIALEDESQLNESPSASDPLGNPVTPGQYYYNNDYQGIIDNFNNGPKHAKIIQWNGANDTNVWMEAQVRFYRAAATLLGNGQANYAGLSSWWRYYHAPGVGHCGGDVGASPTNSLAPDGNLQMFDDLVNWVENGVVPQSAGNSTQMGILASGSVGTRPICPWPTTAIYNGTGSTSVASNYHCGGNLDSTQPTVQTNNVPTLCKLPILAFGNTTSTGMNYQEEGITPTQCPVPAQVATHDFNGFNGMGYSSILWRNTGGAVATWLMNGTTVTASAGQGSVPTSWAVVGQRDFDGDGNADILWRDTSGDVAMWLMNGSNIVSSLAVGAPSVVPTTWSVVATGDFNGDGMGDILWRDSVTGDVNIWLMNGASILQSAMVATVPTNWVVAGADSKGDIFWRNNTTGDVAMWVMNGTTVAQTVDFGSVTSNWQIAGIGDFDSNGSSDILWRDGTSGNVAIWFLNGTQILSSASLGAVPARWSIAQTGDYNGDGFSDILWIDTAGDLSVWFMNGGTVAAAAPVANVGTTWNVQSVNAD